MDFKKFPFCRSPRHSIMLTRRHSFYKDGSNEQCRTVSRAKIVQQHKEAVPPTPRIDQALLSSSSKNQLISPKSLLFSNVSSTRSQSTPKNTDAGTVVKSRRRLRLNSESESRLSVLCSKKQNRTLSSGSSNSNFKVTPSKTQPKRVKFSTSSTEQHSSLFDDELPFQSYKHDSTD